MTEIESPTSVDLDSHLALAGAAASSLARLWARLWRQEYLPAETLELCRLLFARMHGSPAEVAAVNPMLPPTGLSTARRHAVLAGKALEDPACSVLFTESERAILLFAEYYWLDAQSITDEAADGVKLHVGEPGLVFLIEALGLIDGRIRAARCLRDLSAHREQPAHVN